MTPLSIRSTLILAGLLLVAALPPTVPVEAAPAAPTAALDVRLDGPASHPILVRTGQERGMNTYTALPAPTLFQPLAGPVPATRVMSPRSRCCPASFELAYYVWIGHERYAVCSKGKFMTYTPCPRD